MLNTLAKDSDVDIGKELNRLQLKLESRSSSLTPTSHRGSGCRSRAIPNVRSALTTSRG